MVAKKGYIRRRAYTRRTPTGKVVHVKAAWIKRRSLYPGPGKRMAWAAKKTISAARRQVLASKVKPARKCPPGYRASASTKRKTYKRKAYRRKAYIRKDGTRVKAAMVKASRMPKTTVRGGCRKITGRRRRSRARIGPVFKGVLARHGYAQINKMSATERRVALNKAILAAIRERHLSKRDAIAGTRRRVQALVTWNKYKRNQTYRTASADVRYLTKKFNKTMKR